MLRAVDEICSRYCHLTIAGATGSTRTIFAQSRLPLYLFAITVATADAAAVAVTAAAAVTAATANTAAAAATITTAAAAAAAAAGTVTTAAAVPPAVPAVCRHRRRSKLSQKLQRGA